MKKGLMIGAVVAAAFGLIGMVGVVASGNILPEVNATGTTNSATIKADAIGSGSLSIATNTSYNVIGSYANDLAADTGYDWGAPAKSDGSEALTFTFGIGGTISSINFDVLVTGNNMVFDFYGGPALSARGEQILRTNLPANTYHVLLDGTNSTITGGTPASNEGTHAFASTWKYYTAVVWAVGGTKLSIKDFVVTWGC